jgi:hypothetical protein
MRVKHHILVFGSLADLVVTVTTIRRYTLRDIIFLTEEIPNRYILQNIQRIRNFCLIYGSYINIFHVLSLNVEKAWKCLILNSETIETNEE